jgi:hypothetical protein
MDIVSSASTAIAIVKRLREISKNIEEAEFKNLLADLSNELADVKLEAAALKEAIAALKEENAQLKNVASPPEKLIGTKWGCYQFENDDGLYCTACWDTKRQKCRTTRASSRFRLCPVCQAPHGA